MTNTVTQEAVASVGWLGADSLLAGLKRVNLFCGGYGSGKTEVAVNFALHLARAGRKVSIADLDIVNLYFRSREVRAELRRHGVEVLVPGEALVNADLPIITPEVKGAIDRPAGYLVLDLGGDPVGAKVMASLAQGMDWNDYSGFVVLNSRRPKTNTVAGAKQLIEDLEASARVPVTGIVVNSHLIEETAGSVVEEGISLAEEVARVTGRGIAFVVVERQVLTKFGYSANGVPASWCRYPVMVLDRLMLKPWEQSNWLGKYRIGI
ncbi:MAG: hypothetical protein ABIK86_04555 [candidate division WOR-3 bacterium]